jgi:cation-transporting ATPase E
VLKVPFSDGMITTVAALIGMIPEGLYLLVSVALTVSVMRLAKHRTLVQDMRCIEMLARVDVLCVDKTGTITEPEMNVREVVPLCPDRFTQEDIAAIMADYLGGARAENETMAALGRFFTGRPARRVTRRLAFSSATKFAGAELSDGTAFLVGAWEKILANAPARVDVDTPRGTGIDPYAKKTARVDVDIDPYELCEKYSNEGYRVLLLAQYDGDVEAAARGITGEAFPVALVLLTNKIRETAPATFRFFAEQGVSIRVISGDNPQTVSRIALDAGIAGAERYIDASELKTERQIRRAAEEYTVFGRVTPDVKRRLIRAMKAQGHTVAMTGDGVNDVLALKDADCGIAMASGSEVATHVAQLVLLDSDFSAMTHVVMEGRRVINNIERSASLFLVKNIFSFSVTLLALIFTMSYPMTPSQLTLFNVMFIGVPSFVLALEPNRGRVRGRFLTNVLLGSLPAGLCDLGAVLAVMFLGEKFALTPDELSTMATIVIAFVGLLMLIKVSLPLDRLRRALIIAMAAGFALGATVLHRMFNMSGLSGRAALIAALVCVATVPVMFLLTAAARRAGAILRGKPAAKSSRRVKV